LKGGLVLQCEITGINHRGEGVGRIDGKVVFIPFAIPGETVEFSITQDKKSFLRGILQDIIKPSPNRVEPWCPHYYECGGCAYQHVDYDLELNLKRIVAADSLQRIGKLNVSVAPVIGMDNPWRYRNKVEWNYAAGDNGSVLGYMEHDGHNLLDIKTCKLITREMEGISTYIKDNKQLLRIPQKARITIRQSSVTKGLMVIISGFGSEQLNIDPLVNYPGMESIFTCARAQLHLRWGKTYLEERIGKIKYFLSPLSFFQVNHEQASKMFHQLREEVGHSERLLDAYCGVGSISLLLASKAKIVYGIEEYPAAIDCAVRNAEINRISNCNFIAGACEEILAKCKADFDTVVLDPPRAGCDRRVMEALIKMSPLRIFYVSCNPATLARDLGILVQNGYVVNEVQPFDMFPRTSHVECCVLMCASSEAGKC